MPCESEGRGQGGAAARRGVTQVGEARGERLRTALGGKQLRQRLTLRLVAVTTPRQPISA